MSIFKVKHEKTKYLIEINTLDETHKKITNAFQNKRDFIPKKKRRLDIIKNQLDKLEKKPANEYTLEDIKKKCDYKMEIEKITDDIYDIENNLSELDYYFKTEDIIMDYYEMVDTNDHVLYSDHPELSQAKQDETNTNTNNKLEQLNDKNKYKRKQKRVTKKRHLDNKHANNTDIMSFFEQKVETETDTELTETTEKCICKDKEDRDALINAKTKTNLLDQYMVMVSGDYSSERKKNLGIIRQCNTCKIDKTLIHSEGIYVCQSCGEVEAVIIDSEKPNYKESVSDTKPVYAYKRANHLNEWLSQFQAKESIEIPEEVYNKILAELHKNRFHDLKKLNLPYMKKTLKNLGLQFYYEHITYIISKLSGIPPPTISRETEDKIRLMFRQIQVPFEKFRNKIKSRKNFLSYSYVLHKFFQLLELDDYIKYFPLLKSREKLKLQDIIWKKICEELGWDFISSV